MRHLAVGEARVMTLTLKVAAPAAVLACALVPAVTAPPAIIPVTVIHRQEVRPMNAVSVMGAPLQSTIARLR